MNVPVERTLVLIKPDAVLRGLIGEIIARFERAGLVIAGMKMLQPSLEHARSHYPSTDAQLAQMGNKTLETYQELNIDALEQLGTDNPIEIGRMVHEWNAEFLSAAPIIAVVLKGPHCVKKVRALAGKTMPRDAAPGTIRGDYSSSSPAVSNQLRTAVHNLIHASDNELDPREPDSEIQHWFTESEIYDYDPAQSAVMFTLK